MESIFSGVQVVIGIIVGWVLCGRFYAKRIESEKTLAAALLESERQKLEVVSSMHEKEVRKMQETFSLEFENLSTRIFKEKSREFAETSQSKIQEILDPLKMKMDQFQGSVHEIYKSGTAERLSLKNKIESMVDSSRSLAEETNRLSRALKGDVKRQGAWGELVLQKVLEASGLRKHEEYTLQGIGLELANGEGRRMQPDVIINLPDAKSVIIDSKMSYRHYDDYYNASSSLEKEESLKKLIVSMKDHVKDLSDKSYQFAPNLESPNFVLMFVPIEAIFSLVMESEPALFEEAWKKSIIIVSPANLLAILRTIESIWKMERQNRNTQRIAEEGAALYDKFVDFLKDLEGVGRHLKNTNESFDKAFSKLSSGRGNLIKKTEDLKRLGLKTKKQLPEEFIEEALEEKETMV